jgi:hypothetical protein
MDIVAWLGWALLSVRGVLWSILWFLIAGWVFTVLQVALLVVLIYFVRYGWQRSPAEVWLRTRSFGHFFWSWLRAREPQTSSSSDVREVVRVREPNGRLDHGTTASETTVRRPHRKSVVRDTEEACRRVALFVGE